MQRNTSTLCGGCKQHPQEIGSVEVSLFCKRQLYVYFIYVSLCWTVDFWIVLPLKTLGQFCSRKTSSDSDVHSTSYAQGARETSTAGTVPPVATPRKSRDEVAEGCFISAMTATGRGFNATPVAGCRRCSEQRGSNHNTSKGRVVGW